jgi:hypothetical protein
MHGAEDTEIIDQLRRFLAGAQYRATLPYLLVGLLLIVAVMVLVSRMARKAVTQAVAETDTERAESNLDTA